jgi:hypothetical protein
MLHRLNELKAIEIQAANGDVFLPFFYFYARQAIHFPPRVT